MLKICYNTIDFGELSRWKSQFKQSKGSVKMNMKFWNKKCACSLFFSVMLLISSMLTPAFAATKLYDDVTKEIVTKGVTYEKNHRLNTEGWQDIHVLKVDLNDPNLAIAPVESKTELGLKETVLKMVSESGAVAGVNADFFGMKGEYSASFGPVIKDGEIQSVGTDRNLGKKEYSTFFLDEEGNPFIDFLTIQADFYANNYYHLELASLNKITGMEYPIYFDRNGAETTADLDKRFPELVKFVIDNNVITKISAKGETVTVPENGYLIILNGNYYDDVSQYYQVGQTADLRIKSSLDLEKIQTAISGAGKILADGEIPADPGLVITGRQPRTALGISQDKSTLILMVVDGRTHSIGATHDEMAWLMREYGAYNAMHLDGGGSSTMVVKTKEDSQVEVKNTVSDGAQRKVMNSLGVFNNGPKGPTAHLELTPSAQRAFVGNPVTINAAGYDEYYHKTDVPSSEIVYTVTGGEGTVSGNSIMPTSPGNITVTASWNGITAQITFESMTIAALSPSINSIVLSREGESSQPIGFTGISTDGFTGDINGGVSYTLSDETLGTMNGNIFTASKTGSGYLTCQFGNVVCYIPISVMDSAVVVNSFEDVSSVNFSGYPSNVTGGIGLSDTKYNDGMHSLALQYTFGASDSTQAAYALFGSSGKIGGEPAAIRLSVFGNGSGHWLRGKLRDSAGKEYILDFTKNINWNGTWQDVTAAVPAGAAYPVTLENVYAVSLNNTNTTEKVLYLDKLSVVSAPDTANVPKTPTVTDAKQGSVDKAEDGAYYINIIGAVSSGVAKSPALYDSERQKAKTFVESGADLAVYNGGNDISLAPAVDTIKWSQAYQFYNKPHTSIVQMTASKGGLRTTNPTQWTQFKNDILSHENPNVIFIMDKTPSDFNDTMETLLFRSVLNDIRKAGKNVFVVSTSGTGYWSNLKDGIRYVNLPRLWMDNGNVNTGFAKLKFRVNGSQITYEKTNMY